MQCKQVSSGPGAFASSLMNLGSLPWIGLYPRRTTMWDSLFAIHGHDNPFISRPVPFFRDLGRRDHSKTEEATRWQKHSTPRRCRGLTRLLPLTPFYVKRSSHSLKQVGFRTKHSPSAQHSSVRTGLKRAGPRSDSYSSLHNPTRSVMFATATIA